MLSSPVCRKKVQNDTSTMLIKNSDAHALHQESILICNHLID